MDIPELDFYAPSMRRASDEVLIAELIRRGVIKADGNLNSRIKPTREFPRAGGIYTMELYGPDGRLKDRRLKHNLVVNAGLNWIKEYAFDSVTPTVLARMSRIAIGTGATAETPADTTLQTEIARQVFTNPGGYVAGGVGVCTVLTTYAAGVGTGAITEAGVFNDPAAGQMWNRVTFSAVNKAAGDTLKVTVTMTFTAT